VSRVGGGVIFSSCIGSSI